LSDVPSGLVVVVSGPSGVGKSTLLKKLTAAPGRRVAVSATTRAPRTGEVEGVDYRFVDAAGFQSMIDSGAMLEWAEVHGRRYGTPSDEVDPYVAKGALVVLDIDVQGFRSVRAKRPKTPGIFLAPPSIAELERRIRGRGTEDEASLKRRLAAAKAEIAAATAYDAVVVNDDPVRALSEIETLLEKFRGRR
jgi:guanylate kinase